MLNCTDHVLGPRGLTSKKHKFFKIGGYVIRLSLFRVLMEGFAFVLISLERIFAEHYKVITLCVQKKIC